MAVLWLLLATLAVSGVVAYVIVRRNRSRAAERLAEVPGAVQRSTAATSLGQESQEAKPVRGTGTLVLTDREVAFAPWQSKALVRIPRASIREVDTTRSHLGKNMNNDVLRVRWSDAGAEDSVAFFVRDLDGWLTDLGGTRRTDEAG